MIGILPLYYVVAVLYSVLVSKETWIEWIRLLPVELFGFQSAFSSLFSVSHNSGTWYISCLLMCYFTFPLINDLLRGEKKRTLITIALIIGFIVVYSPYIVRIYMTKDIYSNPFFRILEFMIGVMLFYTSIFTKKKNKQSNMEASLVLLALFFVLVVLVSIAYKYTGWVRDYMSYSIITLPILGMALIISSFIEFEEGWLISRIIVFSSSLAYPFWMAQFFVWPMMKHFVMPIVSNNVGKIVISFVVNVIIALILEYAFNRPLKKISRIVLA